MRNTTRTQATAVCVPILWSSCRIHSRLYTSSIFALLRLLAIRSGFCNIFVYFFRLLWADCPLIYASEPILWTLDRFLCRWSRSALALCVFQRNIVSVWMSCLHALFFPLFIYFTTLLLLLIDSSLLMTPFHFHWFCSIWVIVFFVCNESEIGPGLF
jgi:hypothetical protein